MIRWASVCSGIGAPECAWRDLFGPPVYCAEIARFPSAVLEHHFPEVPNRGDFTRIEGGGDLGLLVGGTPCQDFSVAGLRAGLAGRRGQLTVEFCRLLGRERPRWLVWENVPGVLSADGGRAFGTFLGLLGELGYGWAYRVFDAQYAGVPQRRRRVFLVGHLGDWRPPAAVLFERHSLQGHPAPRRQTREGVVPCLRGGAAERGHRKLNGSDRMPVVALSLTADQQRLGGTAETLVYSETGSGWWAEGVGALRESQACKPESGVVAHSLRAEGFDAGEDGTGRGVPLIPFDTTHSLQAHRAGSATEDGTGSGAHPPAIAFSCKDSGLDAGDQAPTLRAMGFTGSHANAGGQVAAAIPIQDGTHPNKQQNGAGVGDEGDPAFTIDTTGAHAIAYAPTVARTQRSSYGKSTANDGSSDPEVVAYACQGPNVGEMGTLRAGNGNTGDGVPFVPTTWAVRRLTPLECERLQGLPDGWTAVTYRGKPAQDGPRYQALGNSMAVPDVRWIGQRIALVEQLLRAQESAA